MEPSLIRTKLDRIASPMLRPGPLGPTIAGLLLTAAMAACTGSSPTEPDSPPSASSLVVRFGHALQALPDSGGAADTLLLTTGDDIAFEHEVSPDGAYVAFFTLPGGSQPRQLHVATLDGSSSVQVTGFAGVPRTVSWSPDSRVLAFATQSPSQILTVSRDGSALDTIVDAPYYSGNPQWSPRGDRIVYAGLDTRISPSSGVWTVRLDGSDPQLVTDATVFIDGSTSALLPAPRVSPDGEWIAFESGHDLYVVRTDGTQRRQLTFTDVEDEWYPRWSPDGQRIAYIADGGTRWMIRILEAATGAESGSVEYDQASDRDVVYPAWSPDGERIAFMVVRMLSGPYRQPGLGSIAIARSTATSNWGAQGPVPEIIGEGAFPKWWPWH